jgi:chemotaxis signal transduction protein
MKIESNPEQKSFVLFSLGTKRFALPSEKVSELVGASHLHLFRHSNPLLLGVLVRRGRIVPVLDVARMVCGTPLSTRKFHLIAKQRLGDAVIWTAIPVTGECELISGLEPFPPSNEHPAWVAGLLILVESVVEILDLDKLTTALQEPASAASSLCLAEVHA